MTMVLLVGASQLLVEIAPTLDAARLPGIPVHGAASRVAIATIVCQPRLLHHISLQVLLPVRSWEMTAPLPVIVPMGRLVHRVVLMVVTGIIVWMPWLLGSMMDILILHPILLLRLLSNQYG